ncbi:hypothetical protein [Nostoc sp. CMAA1605]|uniref:hypothetical protein n=1 Tax=Nostoc sp. CMAA1605 TaxID=2055159 RepID=UPI001F1A53EE|nr:hypothetical protein [Nostoc sp. CMAA1605]MCF4970804.1 hypothetical protein [Nostoc sp. CMAA1605]
MELNLSYEGCNLILSAVHERGGRVLAEMAVEGEVLGSLEILPHEWRAIRDAGDKALAAVEAEQSRREIAARQVGLPL